MLQIMERPIISARTSFQRHQRVCTATAFDRTLSRTSSHKSIHSQKGKARPRSRSLSEGKTTTAGVGPVSLNISARKKSLKEISRENYKLVNHLLQVKARVPLAEDLHLWSGRQMSLREKIGTVRYGSPKPLQGLSVRMSLNNKQLRSGSQISSESADSAQRKEKGLAYG